MTTKALCHFNGTDGAGGASDVVPGVTWTFYNTAQLDTGRKKFGSASLLCPNGADYATATGIAGVSASGNYTFEAFVELDADGSYALINFGVLGFGVRIEFTDTFGSINLQWSAGDAGGSEIFSRNVSPSMGEDTSYHVAVSRSGTTWYLLFNGSRIDSFSSATNTGALNEITAGASGGFAYVWIDEVRVTDQAEYTGTTYTVPSAEFTVVDLQGFGTASATGAASLTTGILLTTGGSIASATGAAALTAQILLEAAGTAVALGDADLFAGLTLPDAHGTAEATGAAELTNQPLFFCVGSATATGAAELSIEARLKADGQATAVGAASLYTEILLEAHGTATALGSISAFGVPFFTFEVDQIPDFEADESYWWFDAGEDEERPLPDRPPGDFFVGRE